MSKIIIYSDGACKDNQFPDKARGGYGALKIIFRDAISIINLT